MPAALSRPQALAHVLLLQDLLGHDALLIDFRGRIALAVVVAFLLIGLTARPVGARTEKLLRQLGILKIGEMSYSIFLIHFSVCLAVNAVVARAWPEQRLAHAIGLLAALGLSIAAGALLWRWVESPSAFWRSASRKAFSSVKVPKTP